MVRMENHLGIIEISQEYFSYLVGHAVQSCYGVAGMVRSGARQGLRSIFTRRAHADDGVIVHSDGDRLVIDVHIAVVNGINIAAISRSIVNKVRYAVEEATGLEVRKVNVFVDQMKAD